MYRATLIFSYSFSLSGYYTYFWYPIPLSQLNYYPCQGQSALSMPNFNEASLSDTLQLVYSYKILWETGSLIPFYIGHYYNNQSSHQSFTSEKVAHLLDLRWISSFI